MMFIRFKAFILRVPLLRRAAVATRDWAARIARGLAGQHRMAQFDSSERQAMELEIYRLRSSLHRAIASAERERKRRQALEKQHPSITIDHT